MCLVGFLFTLRHTICRSEMRSLLCNNALSQHYIPEDLKPQHGCMLEHIFSIFFFPHRCGQWVHLDIIHFSCVIVTFVLIIFAACFVTVVFDIFIMFFWQSRSIFSLCSFDSHVRYFHYVLLTVTFDIFVMFFWQSRSIFSLCSFDSRVRYFRHVLLTVAFNIFIMFFFQSRPVFSLCSFDSCVWYFRYFLLTVVFDIFVMFFWQLCSIFSLCSFII